MLEKNGLLMRSLYLSDGVAKLDFQRLYQISRNVILTVILGNANILELERKFQNAKDTYKSVTLEWDVELEDKLSLTGDILLNGVTQEQIRDYKKIEMPVATIGKHSKYVSSSPGVFC